jgi:hypothetical protein
MPIQNTAVSYEEIVASTHLGGFCQATTGTELSEYSCIGTSFPDP